MISIKTNRSGHWTKHCGIESIMLRKATVNCEISKHLYRARVLFCRCFCLIFTEINITERNTFDGVQNIRSGNQMVGRELDRSGQNQRSQRFLVLSTKLSFGVVTQSDLLQQHNYDCSTCLFITGIKS